MPIDHTQASEFLEHQIAETQHISAKNSNVTRVTLELVLQKIESYVSFLLKWNKSYNLIATTTVKDVWGRHIVDSAQIWPHLFSPSYSKDKASAQTQQLVDLGTGAGFPGMVLAIMGWPRVTLVESNQKKCLFLNEVVRQLTLSNVTIISQRVEKIPPLQADVIVARALAPLTRLLTWAYPHLDKSGKCIFHKGERWQEELTQAQKYWTMSVKQHPSVTGKTGVILEIDGLSHVHARTESTI